MVMVCRNRPIRKNPRKHNVCSVVRTARAAAKNGENRGEIVASVAFALGFYQVVDGTRFTEEAVKEEIAEVLRRADIISEIAAVIPVVGLAGIILRLFLKFTTTTAAVIAPIVLYLLERHRLKAINACGL